jgi:murein DD-endopeptidase MepM/ murein hydrolase activator NlpD
MIKAELKVRNDRAGLGHFGAPRGAKTHRGIDFECPEGTRIFSLTDGIVTKVGYAYQEDLSFRYVEIQAPGHFKHRYFYCVLPKGLKKGSEVKVGDVIGIVQDIAGKWKGGMKNHCHYEIKDGPRSYIDPNEYWS